MTPDVDAIAPDFELRDSNGESHTLTKLVARERRVLLFYRGHW
jgi:peroxiredoxin